MQRWRSSARNILALAYKEAMLLRRSPLVLGTVLGQPLIFLFLFGHVLSSKPGNVPWGVLDRSQGATSRRLIAEVQASGYFLARHDVASYEEGIAALRRGDILALLVLPPDLEREARRITVHSLEREGFEGGERASLVLRAENLTDARILTRNQGGSIDLAAPRTVWAGLRISFGR